MLPYRARSASAIDCCSRPLPVIGEPVLLQHSYGLWHATASQRRTVPKATVSDFLSVCVCVCACVCARARVSVVAGLLRRVVLRLPVPALPWLSTCGFALLLCAGDVALVLFAATGTTWIVAIRRGRATWAHKE